jgi:hypothetical protein
MVLLSLPAGLQGASPRICALGLWSYTAMARPMSFFPASSFADRAARYSRAASRTAAPLSSQNTMSRSPGLTMRLVGTRHRPPYCEGVAAAQGLGNAGPDICWQPVVRGSSLCEKRGLVCIPSKGMGLCRYGIFGQDLIQPTLCLKYRPSVVSENLCVCSVAFHDMVSSLSYGGCPLLPLSFYNIAKRLTNR